jgi:tetrahydromethanopterin S-methyltransferase subunit B
MLTVDVGEARRNVQLVDDGPVDARVDELEGVHDGVIEVLDGQRGSSSS